MPRVGLVGLSVLGISLTLVTSVMVFHRRLAPTPLMVFTNPNSQFVVLDPETNFTKALSPAPFSTFNFWDWSADRRWLLLTTRTNLNRVHLVDGSSEILLRGVTREMLLAHVDGWVYFIRNGGNHWQLRRIRDDGAVEENLTPREVRLMPNGRTMVILEEGIFFLGGVNTDYGMYRMNLDGSQVRRIAGVANLRLGGYFLQIGDWLLFNHSGYVQRVGLDGGEVFRFSESIEVPQMMIAAPPNRVLLISDNFPQRQVEVYEVDTMTHEPIERAELGTEVLWIEPVFVLRATNSRGSDLFLTRLRTSQDRIVVNFFGGTLGTDIFAARDGEVVVLYEMVGIEPRELTAVGGTLDRLELSPDGRWWYIYVREEAIARVYRVPSEGGEKKLVTEGWAGNQFVTFMQMYDLKWEPRVLGVVGVVGVVLMGGVMLIGRRGTGEIF